MTAETRSNLNETLEADECLRKPVELLQLLSIISRYHC
jgi:hypothetical protein